MNYAFSYVLQLEIKNSYPEFHLLECNGVVDFVSKLINVLLLTINFRFIGNELSYNDLFNQVVDVIVQ